MFQGSHSSYDVVVAGARVAGAATAMLLAERGLRVLVVDPVPQGRDTLSTHALMRGAVVQLNRWGLLDRLREAGTPTISEVTFYYGPEQAITVPLEPRDGIDGLYAPRRTVLDPILVDAAREAGAHFLYGAAAAGLVWDDNGRVRGVDLNMPEGGSRTVETPLVIGADGMNSKIARLVDAPSDLQLPHATANIYGYWKGLGNRGYQWYFGQGIAAGAIPTNHEESCVFVSMPPERFHREKGGGLDALYHTVVREMSPELAERLTRPASRRRAFPGAPGRLRRSAGPGWALVGDAGYFKDPLTAHGMTDALRDAELLARAVVAGGDDALAGYQARRDRMSEKLLRVTDRIASFDWTYEEVGKLHRELSQEMKAEVAELMDLAEEDGRARTSESRAGDPALVVS